MRRSRVDHFLKQAWIFIALVIWFTSGCYLLACTVKVLAGMVMRERDYVTIWGISGLIWFILSDKGGGRHES